MIGRLAVVVVVLATVGCGDGEEAGPGPGSVPAEPTTTGSDAPTPAEEGCADVVDAAVTWVGESATVSTTVRSADTGWDKYADRWEVRTLDGEVLGERVLTHPHENEQPFTRTLSGVEIPPEVERVVIAAHDSVAGWCGDTLNVDLPAR